MRFRSAQLQNCEVMNIKALSAVLPALAVNELKLARQRIMEPGNLNEATCML